MKKFVSILCLVLVMVSCFAMGIMAAGNLEEVKAYLNHGITIKLDGKTQALVNNKGEKVVPITYNGTTYLPLRVVSNMLGVAVAWDGANNQVLLGDTTIKDFIDELEPYTVNGVFDVYQTNDLKTKTIAGKTYNHWIMTRSSNLGAYYDLGGRYNELTFKAYTEDKDTTIYFYGDNEQLLASCTVQAKATPQEYTVDLKGVTQLTIKGDGQKNNIYVGYPIYIMDAGIK